MTAITGLQLPFRFDAARLKRDLALIPASAWVPHYNENDFGGRWEGVALRSRAGASDDLYAGSAGPSSFIDTPVLRGSEYFPEVLAAFGCPLKSVRLLSLGPGSFIREHSDNALGFEDGEVRIHVPVETNPGVEFYVCGERLLFEEGGCYYVNVNLPHRVNNRGTSARVHLVIDAMVDDRVRAIFAKGSPIARSTEPPQGFREFAALVFADESLRERLRAIGSRRELLREAEREARARGFDLNEADIAAAFRSEAFHGAGSSRGWIPTRISFRESQPWAEWIYSPDHRFTEPFFEDSVRVCRRNAFTSLFRGEMPLLRGDVVRPDGFIFHMSRCGSTLISRSLAAADAMHVISEAPPLDTMVQANRPEWVEWIVSALGRIRSTGQTWYAVKTDAWHVRSLALFRAAFPDVPWIFVYRDPLEVLVSQLSRPGLQASPGAMDPAVLGMLPGDITGLTRQRWCTRVIGNLMAAALGFADDPAGIYVDYRELPGAIGGRIAKHFGLRLSAEDEKRIEAATRVDAKNPYAEFAPDHDEKRKRAAALEKDDELDGLRELYERLTQLSRRTS